MNKSTAAARALKDDLLDLFVGSSKDYREEKLADLMAFYGVFVAEIRAEKKTDFMQYRTSLATLVELADLYGLLLVRYPNVADLDKEEDEESWISCPLNEDIAEWIIARAAAWLEQV